ncbi:MAG: DUF5320 domain-containing protein [Sedimentibacter sp.]
MPRRDGTGPMGRGAMTGRGLGVCNGMNVNGYGVGYGRGYGRGLGLGLGAGYGCRRGFATTFVGESVGLTDKELLMEQKELLQNRLDIVTKQLENS